MKATAMHKKAIVILVLIAGFAGDGYEATRAHQLREHAQSFHRQQTPLIEEIQTLRRERDEAAREDGALSAENGRLTAQSRPDELQRLRAELAQWKTTATRRGSNNTEAFLTAWLNQVSQLKQYVQEHPEKCIPEFQFLADRDWLITAADVSARNLDFSFAVECLKPLAVDRFATLVERVLQKYSQANGGQFPTDLSQLQPYCAQGVENILQRRYEIGPASVLPKAQIQPLHTKTESVIAGKESVSAICGNHIAIYTNGHAYFW
jgi:hypothetical protein